MKPTKWKIVGSDGKEVRKQRRPSIKTLMSKTPNWSNYEQIENISLWEFTCLSCDVNPDDRLIQYGEFKSSLLRERLKVLASWIPQNNGPRPQKRDYIAPYRYKVNLKEFIKKSVDRELELPNALKILHDKQSFDETFEKVHLPYKTTETDIIFEAQKLAYKDNIYDIHELRAKIEEVCEHKNYKLSQSKKEVWAQTIQPMTARDNRSSQKRTH